MAIRFNGGNWQNPQNYMSDELQNSAFNPNLQSPPPELLKTNFAQKPNYFNPVEVGIRNDLLNFKKMYEDANAGINLLTQNLASGNLNDEQQKAAQNQMAVLRAQQESAAREANITRNTARNLGINTNGFNSDDTFEDAQQTMQTNSSRAISELLNLPSVQMQQRNYYDQMRQVGLSPRLARKAAEEMHDEFREQNVNQLMNGFQSYGLDENGTINQTGMAILGKMINENPHATQLFSQSFASPKDYFGEVQANYRQNVAAENQARMQQNSFQNEREKLRALRNFEWNKMRAQQEFDWNKQKDAQEHAANLAVLRSALNATGTPQNSRMQEIGFLTQLTGNEETAAKLWLYQHYGKAIESLTSEGGNLESANKFENFTERFFGAIEYFLNEGNMEQAGELIDNFSDKLLNEDLEKSDVLDREMLGYILPRLEAYKQVANGKMSLEELKKYLQPAQNLNQKLNNPFKLREQYFTDPTSENNYSFEMPNNPITPQVKKSQFSS